VRSSDTQHSYASHQKSYGPYKPFPHTLSPFFFVMVLCAACRLFYWPSLTFSQVAKHTTSVFTMNHGRSEESEVPEHKKLERNWGKDFR
jgi:hypothetical protein